MNVKRGMKNLLYLVTTLCTVFRVTPVQAMHTQSLDLRLAAAVSYGDLDAVSNCLRAGADVGRRDYLGNALGIGNWRLNPIPVRTDVVYALLEYGAQPTAGHIGQAVRLEKPELLRRLLARATVDLNAPGAGGGTLLAKVVCNNRTDMATMLLDYGVSPNTSDTYDADNALKCARDRGNKGLETLLLQRGAQDKDPYRLLRPYVPVLAATGLAAVSAGLWWLGKKATSRIKQMRDRQVERAQQRIVQDRKEREKDPEAYERREQLGLKVNRNYALMLGLAGTFGVSFFSRLRHWGPGPSTLELVPIFVVGSYIGATLLSSTLGAEREIEALTAHLADEDKLEEGEPEAEENPVEEWQRSTVSS